MMMATKHFLRGFHISKTLCFRSSTKNNKSTSTSSTSTTATTTTNIGIQKDADINKIKILQPLLREANLIELASTSNTKTMILSSSEQETPEELTVEPINPKIVFREKMRALRREYQKQYIEKKEKQKIEEERLESERLAQYERFKADVARFKQETEHRLSDITYDPALDSRTPEEISKEAQEKDAKLEGIKLRDKKRRFERKLGELEKLKEQRMIKLTHLFHETKYFVTYSNIDYKIDQAFKCPIWYTTNMEEAVASAEISKKEEVVSFEEEITNIMEFNSERPQVHHIEDILEEHNLSSPALDLTDLEKSVKDIEEMQKKQKEDVTKRME